MSNQQGSGRAGSFRTAAKYASNEKKLAALAAKANERQVPAFAAAQARKSAETRLHSPLTYRYTHFARTKTQARHQCQYPSVQKPGCLGRPIGSPIEINHRRYLKWCGRHDLRPFRPRPKVWYNL